MKSILIIDDDKFLLDMYAKKFNSSGFEVNVASGGDEALKIIEGGLNPDVLVTDVTMPGMDGFEFLEKLKSENKLPNALRIMLTNQNMEEDVKKAHNVGAHGYIVKATMIPSEVVEAVSEIINKNQSKDGLQADTK